jgi:hypothetical protein
MKNDKLQIMRLEERQFQGVLFLPEIPAMRLRLLIYA